MLPSRRQLLAILPFAALGAQQRPAVVQRGRKAVTFWFAQAGQEMLGGMRDANPS